jgi:hypothetical protein
MISSAMMKLTGFFAIIIVLFVIIFGFLFFEPFLTEKEETITIINKERWVGEKSSYFIFTDKEVFLNANNYYHNKENADELYPLLKPGFSYKVRIIGMSIPFITRFRNIIEIVDDDQLNVPFQKPRK